MHLARPLLLVAITLLHLAVASDAAPPAPRYTLTDLGALTGGQNSVAYAINNCGWVVGWADATAGDPDKGFLSNHAVLWREGQVQDLGLMTGTGYPCDVARGINDLGQIVGGWTVVGVGAMSAFSPDGAFLWEHGQMTVLDKGWHQQGGALPHMVNAVGINATGQIAGEASRNFVDYPVRWEDGKLEALPLPPGDIGGCVGSEKAGGVFNDIGGVINAKGEVVGTTMRQKASHILDRIVLWRAGRVIDLGQLPPLPLEAGDFDQDNGEALAINDRSQVVGVSNGKAFLWERGKMRALPPLLADQPLSEALAINGHGWVVGVSTFSHSWQPGHAVLWRDRRVYDLNALIAPDSHWVLERAYGINDRGQIVGEGQKGGHPCAFLLTPVDDPK